ncbi:ABC transporter permease [Nitratireductor aestuarii]|uniref:ABC transporter permease n=1 Tax=Nitratireductor aestuarii TaxID=1735103 RepID=UPI0016630ABA|nr:ABC transporter permease [Nitratireductor aestuarii]
MSHLIPVSDTAEVQPAGAVAAAELQESVRVRRHLPWWRLLLRDKFATASVVWFVILLAFVFLGPLFLSDKATAVNLAARNAPPGFSHGFLNILGADPLGRPLLPRLMVGARNTLAIAFSSVICALVLGSFLGMIAGYVGGIIGNLIMRLADVISSFPSLLLALIVLYILEPHVMNLVLVLAITRTSIYLRVTRAEVLEIRERAFVDASRALGGGAPHILRRHIAPLVAPTLGTIVTVDFAAVMLAESALSFLGIGIQPPEITWGLMVAQGRNYLTQAWWLAFVPGAAIMLTTLSANLISSWLRIINDPAQRWRLEISRKEAKP